MEEKIFTIGAVALALGYIGIIGRGIFEALLTGNLFELAMIGAGIWFWVWVYRDYKANRS